MEHGTNEFDWVVIGPRMYSYYDVKIRSNCLKSFMLSQPYRYIKFYSITELVSLIQFDPSDPIPPANSIEYGSQGDEFKRVWSVIADTSNGKLPGNEMPYIIPYLDSNIIYRIMCS